MANAWRGVVEGAHGFTRPVAIKQMHSHLAESPLYVDMFVEESREILARMGDDLRALEAAPGDRKKVDSLFRGSHSIKVMASSLAMGDISSLAQALEMVFRRLRQGDRALDGVLAEGIFLGIDTLRGAVEEVAVSGSVRTDLESARRALLERASGEPGPPRAAPAAGGADLEGRAVPLRERRRGTLRARGLQNMPAFHLPDVA